MLFTQRRTFDYEAEKPNNQSELWESVSWSLGLSTNRAGLRNDLKSET